jgi:hypothetical protein
MPSKSLVAGAIAVALAAAAAPGASAATKSMRLFSQTQAERGYDAAGNAVTDPNHEPAVGDAFVGVDRLFRGTHAKHARKAIGSDHVTCTFLTVALPATLTARCDAQLALPGGMVFSDRGTIDLTAERSSWPVTGGSGRYAGVTGGVITVTNVKGGSDLKVRLVSA